MLKQFVRNDKRNKVGVLVAKQINDTDVSIGWSKCHMGMDKFDKARGEKIAVDRAVIGTNSVVPSSIE